MDQEIVLSGERYTEPHQVHNSLPPRLRKVVVGPLRSKRNKSAENDCFFVLFYSCNAISSIIAAYRKTTFLQQC